MFLEQKRIEMVENLKNNKIIISSNVYSAMKKVPRHLFIPEKLWHRAYLDSPQQIGKKQTISAPHMNAMMCEYLEIERNQRILEIGTGSGYHAALLAELVGKSGHVYTIEIVEGLITFAQKNLERTGYDDRVTLIHGDGGLGLSDHAPFDRILVAAAAPQIPDPLIEQLAPGGIMLIPVGSRGFFQDLLMC